MTARTTVGWDGTAASRAALDWAVRSEAPEGELLLVRVVHLGAIPHAASVDSELADAQSAVEDEASTIMRAHPGMHVQAAIVRGDPFEELRKHTGPDTVLVVGTDVPGPLGVKHGWSVGGRLAASAGGPVVIVPLEELGERTGVVVGVDGTEEAFAAAMFAADRAQRRKEGLTVVHAWREPEVWENAFVFDEDFVEQLEAQHEAVLTEMVQVIADSHPALPVTRSLLRGTASWLLLDAARDASLLVVGCRGHRGVKRLFLGSVSHSIVLNIVSPTVVIPHGTVDAAVLPPQEGGLRHG